MIVTHLKVEVFPFSRRDAEAQSPSSMQSFLSGYASLRESRSETFFPKPL